MMCRSNLSYLFTPLLPAVAIAAAAELPAPPENTCAQMEALMATLPKPLQRVEWPEHDDYYPGKTDYRRLLFLMQLWREGALPLRVLPLIECVAEYTAKIGRPEAGVELVRALLAAGAPVDGADGNGEPLLAAVKSGNAPICRALLEAGARTDLVDARGRSLLYSAAVHHHAECVRLLLEKGCRPEFLSDFNTLLHAAIVDPEPEDCMCGADGPPEEAMVEICRALLAAGVDVNVKDRDGATPLLLAVGLDWERPQLVKLLLDAGADMSADRRGYTPLDIAVSCMDEEVSRMLEAAGGVQDKTTPLQLAILLNRPDDVKKLLAAGADTGKSAIRGYEKITPLKYARLLGREEIAHLLSEHSSPEEQPHPAEMKRPQVGGSLLGALVGGGKVQVHALQPQYDGDLWRALSDGDIAECDRLLKAGAKLQPENPNIIDAAIRSAESVRWLMAHGAAVHLFRDTLRMIGRSARNFSRATDKERFRKQVRVLLDAGIPLPEGWNLLHLSAAVGDVELVRRMIAGGVDVNARNDEGNTALLLAVMNDDPESVRLLLEAGAEADAPDAEGVTPLECSVVRYTDPHISRSLLAAGADARRKTRSGDTLLHAALASPERVYYLLRAGADVFARDADGRTPRERAMTEGDADELTVLLLAAFESAARGDAKREPKTPSAETTGTVARLLERALGNTEGQPKWRVHRLTEMRERLCRLQAGEEQVNHYPWVIQLMTTFPSAPGWTIHRQTPFGPFTRVLRDVPTVSEEELLAALTEMVQCGASVNRTDSDGNAALYLAAQNGRESLCRRLIELGADVNRRNSRRKTALHAAAQWGHAACVSALLECGADVELNDGDDCELLKAALTPVIGKNGYLTRPSVEVVRLLLEAGASVNDDELLIRAERYGDAELVRLLARYGADVSLRDSDDKISVSQ